MDTIRFLAMDLAKNVFQVYGVDATGNLCCDAASAAHN